MLWELYSTENKAQIILYIIEKFIDQNLVDIKSPVQIQAAQRMSLQNLTHPRTPHAAQIYH